MSVIRILGSIVGSRAQGLATETSDTDLRGVYIRPTEEMFFFPRDGVGDLNIPDVPENTDQEWWEFNTFMSQVLKQNPNFLEIFGGVPLYVGGYGQELLDLFPAVLDTIKFAQAIRGYSYSQRLKFEKEALSEERKWKYLSTHVRLVFWAEQVLVHRDPTLRLKDTGNHDYVHSVRMGRCNPEAVLDNIEYHTQQVEKLSESHAYFSLPDYDRVNEFIFRVLRAHFGMSEFAQAVEDLEL